MHGACSSRGGPLSGRLRCQVGEGMRGDRGPEKELGPKLLQPLSSSSPFCPFLPPTHISLEVAVLGFRPVGETEARLGRLNAREGTHQVSRAPPLRRQVESRKQLGNFPHPVQAVGGCLLPFWGIQATGTPLPRIFHGGLLVAAQGVGPG